MQESQNQLTNEKDVKLLWPLECLTKKYEEIKDRLIYLGATTPENSDEILKSVRDSIKQVKEEAEEKEEQAKQELLKKECQKTD